MIWINVALPGFCDTPANTNDQTGQRQMWDWIKITAFGLTALLAAIAANWARDIGFEVQALIVMLVAAGLFIWTIRQTDNAPGPKATGYNDAVIRAGVIATTFWGLAGFLVGVIIAFQLAFPALNFEFLQGYGNFGRLRPLHTSAVVFAFGGNALICTSFYIVQRTCSVRLWGGNLGWFVFWGYQMFIVLAATGYLMGVTQGLEYAEPEWYVDLWLTVVWVAYLVVFLGTLMTRAEPHIYVANWFFLTAGFLGMMYYFVLKQAGKPVYSYKLSIIHFWALIFLYIWAGPHHLHYTALPDWAGTLGMVFSVILWMPSRGGMINGLMILSGAWDKIRTDPILRMMVISLGFYGMSTFEGPIMSIRAINSLSHYTDWTIGHVHSGALGWNGMITFAALYFLTPRLWNRDRLYSLSLVNWHFWLATIGIILYASSMWVTGIMEGLMWREVDATGNLVNSFADTVAAKFPMYVVRGLGGVMYLTGALIMTYNLWMTAFGKRQPVALATPAE